MDRMLRVVIQAVIAQRPGEGGLLPSLQTQALRWTCSSQNIFPNIAEIFLKFSSKYFSKAT